jgi:hypothetical protein
MNIEKFASRGLKAQQAVDKVLNNLPAADLTAAVATRQEGAGRNDDSAPRSCAMQMQVLQSTDAAWLKTVMNSQDYTIGIRSAAQRRLAKLFRRKSSRK